MDNRIIYHPLAIKDLNDSMDFYEDRESGLGFRFSENVKQKIAGILNHPERYAKRRGHYREALISQFPFLVVYRFNKFDQKITIASIFHSSRKPKYKYRK
jgi:plasmid stabilization system protein ParE